jgi:hypothetical protein
MCQAHRHLHLCQQAPPGRTAIQRHVRTRDPRDVKRAWRPGVNLGKPWEKPWENHGFHMIIMILTWKI